MKRKVFFRPAAFLDLERLDRDIQVRIVTAIERYAESGHGDFRRLKGRDGEFRLRVGKWRIFFRIDKPEELRVYGIDNRGHAY